MRLKDKAAIVTGGGSGIGAATCERFVEEGAAVVVADINADAAAKVARSLTERGGRAVAVTVDMGDENSVRALVAATLQAFGRIDIIVNNAAVFVLKGLSAEVAEWRRSFDVNVIGSAMLVKHALPELKKSGRGAVVNLGSISSFIAQDNMAVYNASKGAIAQLTRCLALDLAKDSIRVNAVCPGTIWTPVVQRLAAELGLDRAGADRHPAWGGGHMIPRCGEPREIANAVVFLASDEASFITGECLMVDGGYTAK
jgi:dihydroanticapsin dehydrogenase